MKINKAQQFANDRGSFQCLMEFIEVCQVIGIDQIANKYKLHDEERREYDVWYEHHYLWPKMKEFFSEKSSDYIFEQALDELWWYSDQNEPMTDFCNFIKKFAEDMKGSTKAEVIDLDDYGFPTNIYIVSDIDEEVYAGFFL